MLSGSEKECPKSLGRFQSIAKIFRNDRNEWTALGDYIFSIVVKHDMRWTIAFLLYPLPLATATTTDSERDDVDPDTETDTDTCNSVLKEGHLTTLPTLNAELGQLTIKYRPKGWNQERTISIYAQFLEKTTAAQCHQWLIAQPSSFAMRNPERMKYFTNVNKLFRLLNVGLNEEMFQFNQMTRCNPINNASKLALLQFIETRIRTLFRIQPSQLATQNRTDDSDNRNLITVFGSTALQIEMNPPKNAQNFGCASDVDIAVDLNCIPDYRDNKLKLKQIFTQIQEELCRYRIVKNRNNSYFSEFSVDSKPRRKGKDYKFKIALIEAKKEESSSGVIDTDANTDEKKSETTEAPSNRRNKLQMLTVDMSKLSMASPSVSSSSSTKDDYGTAMLLRVKDPFLRLQIDITVMKPKIGDTIAFLNPLLSYRNDSRIRMLVTLVKYWAVSNKLNNCGKGGLSSVSWLILTLKYLQMIRPCVLPIYERNRDGRMAVTHELAPNRQSLAELLFGFFEFWSHNLMLCSRNHSNLIVSIVRDGLLTAVPTVDAEKKGVVPFALDRNYCLFIEDPISQWHNLCKRSSIAMVQKIVAKMKHCQLAMLKNQSFMFCCHGKNKKKYILS